MSPTSDVTTLVGIQTGRHSGRAARNDVGTAESLQAEFCRGCLFGGGLGRYARAAVAHDDLNDLTDLMGKAASALLRGDARWYADLMRHTDDFTLMAPTGGEPRRGFDDSDDALDALARYFRSGEARLEVFQTYSSGELAVLVAVERQRGEVGGLAEQDLSLRVTLVFRRDGESWRLVHRHADPLVHPIGEQQLGLLLRGESPEP
jgi:ketosteroid isomerase-like protein